MTYTIAKDFTWSASHVLTGLPEGHPCARLHGHNYIARVMVQADWLVAPGFVVDYGRLGFIGEFIDTTWDHRHLNDVRPFALDVNPTAENMARWLAEYAEQVLAGHRGGLMVACSVSETPKTWATFTPLGWRP